MKGFTIVELLVVISVSGLLAGMLFGPLNELYTDNNRGLKSVIQMTDTRGSIRSIEHGITLSYSFYNTNQLADPAGTTWNWASGGASSTLITGNYATFPDESADVSGTRTLIYAVGCSTPLLNNYIYFVNTGTLYRRTLKNTAPTCSGSIGQKQTCASGYVNGTCQAVDAKILTGVTNFTVNYYTNPSDITPMANQYTDTTVPANAKAVGITITTASGNGPTYTTSTSTLRMARVNGVTL